VATILSTPETSAITIAQGIVSITEEQRAMLLASYLPFCFIPLMMGIDMMMRVRDLASVGAKALDRAKRH